MELEDIIDSEVTELFVYETEGQLRSLENILSATDRTKSLSKEHTNELFRIMHTIKGSSAMLGYGAFSNTAHLLEDIFSMIRNGEATLDAQSLMAVSDLLYSAMACFRKFAESVSEGRVPEASAALDERINEMKASLKNGALPSDSSSTSGVALCHVEWMEHASSVHVRLKHTPVPCLRALVVIKSVYKLCDEIISVPPEIEKHGELANEIARDGFSILFVPHNGTTAEDVATLIARNIHVESCEVENLNAKAEEIAAEGPEVSAGQGVADKVVSVRKSRLDEHIDLLGELLTSESMLEEAIDARNLMDDSLSRLLAQLGKIARTLHKSAVAMDMAAIDGIFFRLRLIVREMSKTLGKDIDFVCVGGGTEVEREMLDLLYDPLLHMVRNAADHGIESAEDRKLAGKSPRGLVRLEASRYKEDYLRITLSDDGRGIDTQKIKNKAIARGLINEGERHSDQDMFELLLRPGFTLNDDVSEYSGRGVGLDVVNTSLKKLGGSMSIKSGHGTGTVFTITIPASASMVDALELTIGGHRAVMPVSMMRLVITRDNIGVVDSFSGDGKKLCCGSREYTIVDLAKQLGCTGGRGAFILLDRHDADIAVSADNVLQLRTIVKKRLPAFMSAMKSLPPLYAGCTILGDGSVCMVIDTDKIQIE